MARMLAVPLVTMLGLLGVIVSGEVRAYGAAAGASDSVRLALGVQDLVHEMQRERGLTNGLLGGESRFRSDVDKQRARADAARVNVDALIVNDDIAGADAVRTALDLLDDQAELRGGVDAGRAARLATFDYYTRAIDALGALDIGVADASDGIMRQHLAALRALGDAKEASAKERGFLNGVFAAGAFSGDEYIRFADIRATKKAALAEFVRHATAAQRAQADAALRTAAAVKALGYEEAAVAGADGRKLKIDPRSWWDSMTVVVDDLRGVQQSVGSDAQARAADLQGTATTELGVLLALAGLVVLGETLLLVASARSVTAPLAGLAREADEVASRRLPEAVARIQAAPDAPPPLAPVRVPERAGIEVRRVAESLDNVQRVAHVLATEQAVLRRNTTESLANLGRRNQNLLRRQLGFITQLEREESDPSALANLFELDHLATRMRRNAESLLVLVGETSPRRWAESVPVADVIRAAISEVEDYRRVELRRIDDAYVAGSVVTDVAHMIAELVENGLAFSPPELDVEIYGRWTGTQYLVAILDQGVGMTNEELAKANARLCGEESFLLGPARFLGHYVVGRLAQDLGAAVQLAHSPVTGVTARLLLPPAVLSSAHALPPATPPSPRLNGAVEYSVAAASKGEPVLTAFPAQGDTPGSASPDRTRNGLVKRTARRQLTSPPPGPGTVAAPAAVIERQPGEVRSMLSAFRDGTRRAETHAATTAHTTDAHERGSQ
jgi:Nitrate and nitrite sensing/Histidine kinase-, DNA gyrase B-, and HSP90-like ATPase